MKKKIYPLFISLASLLIVGCSLPKISFDRDPSSSDPSDPTTPGGNEEPPIEKEYSIKAPDFSYEKRNSIEEVTYFDLFNLHNKVSIEIDVDKEELDKIQEDNRIGSKPEIYRYAKKVTISLLNDENLFSWEIKDVGIRQKGNTSRRDIFDGDYMNNNHFKLSFDEGFNDVEIYGEEFVSLHGDTSREDREFLGLTGLDIKWNKSNDSTYLKEIYSSYMLRSAGVIVQHIGLSTVKFIYDNNVRDFGLCYLYEPSSKSLVKNSLKSNDKYINMSSWKVEKAGMHGISGKNYGDMYKGTYGSYGNDDYFYGGGVDFSMDSISRKRVGPKTDPYGRVYPVYERKTNKDEDYDDSLLKQAINTINYKSYDEVAEVVDLEYFAIVEAVMYFIGNPDSFRYNYNNIELYIRKTDGKMVFIPIDNDRTFGIGRDWDKGISFSASSKITPLNKLDVNGNSCRNPLFSKILFNKSGNECQEIYKKYIAVVRDSDWAKNNTFVSYYNILTNTYSGLENFSLSGGEDNISFESYITTKVNASNDMSINSTRP